MTAAIVGLLGAVTGAVATLIGSIVTDRRQERREAARWRRDQLAAAYDGALRYLLRAANRRSKIDSKTGAILAEEHVRDWYDDLVESHFWLHTLTSRCGAKHAKRIRAIEMKLMVVTYSMERNTSRKGSAGPDLSKVFEVLQEAINMVTDCAREDLGRTSLRNK